MHWKLTYPSTSKAVFPLHTSLWVLLNIDLHQNITIPISYSRVEFHPAPLSDGWIRDLPGSLTATYWNNHSVGSVSPAVQTFYKLFMGRVWFAIHHGVRSELAVLDWTLDDTTGFTTIAHTQLLFWHNRMWRSRAGQLRVQTWTPLSMFWTKWGSGSETWMTPLPLYQVWTAVRP